MLSSQESRFSTGPQLLPATTELKKTLIEQCEAMSIYALGGGIDVPASVMSVVERATTSPEAQNFDEILKAHRILAATIVPASPAAITLMQRDRQHHPFLSKFGSVPLIRLLLGLALVSLMGLIASSALPEVNQANLRKDMLENSGFTLVVCELFLAFAGLLGSSFATLFRVNDDVVKRTYDPRNDGEYWVQIGLGVISGVVLSQLIFHGLNPGRADTNAASHAPVFEQPLLALLGGFSASLVHKVLSNLLTAAENIFGVQQATPMNSWRAGRLREAEISAVAEQSSSLTPERIESVRAEVL